MGVDLLTLMEHLSVDNLDLVMHRHLLVDNLDLLDNLDRLPILAHEDFSLMHLLLLPVFLDLTDNLGLTGLVDQMEYLTQDNLDNHKVLYLHQQQVMHLRVDFSHYL